MMKNSIRENQADTETTARSSGKGTTLFPIPPIGLGTAAFESLSSYINRLASAHSLSTTFLCSMLFAEREGVYETTNPSTLLFGRVGGRLLCNTKISSDLVSILIRLTGQENLSHIIGARIENIVQIKNHVRSTWSWCPICVNNWIRDRKPVYFPWIWGLDTYSICVEHARPLVHSCPSCRRTWPVMRAKSWSVVCCHCGCSQTEAPEAQTRDHFQPGDWEVRASTQTYRFAQWSANMPQTMVNCFQNNIAAAAETLGSVRKIAKLLNTDHKTVLAWKKGTQIPRLGSVIKFACAFGLQIHELFERPIDYASNPLNTEGTLPKLYPVRNRTLRELQSALETAISDSCVDPPSIASLRRKFDCGRSTMDNRFPTLMPVLCKKRRLYMKQKTAENKQKREERLNFLIAELVAKGKEITCSNIRSLVMERGETDFFAMSSILKQRLRAQHVNVQNPGINSASS